jgi:hypothetical protein
MQSLQERLRVLGLADATVPTDLQAASPVDGEDDASLVEAGTTGVFADDGDTGSHASSGDCAAADATDIPRSARQEAQDPGLRVEFAVSEADESGAEVVEIPAQGAPVDEGAGVVVTTAAAAASAEEEEEEDSRPPVDHPDEALNGSASPSEPASSSPTSPFSPFEQQQRFNSFLQRHAAAATQRTLTEEQQTLEQR